MKVTIRLSTESSFQITIPDNSTVADLRSSVKVGSPNPIAKDFKLIYNGAKLQPLDKSLSSFGMTPDKDIINVILMSNGHDTPPISPQASSENLLTTATINDGKSTTTSTTTPASVVVKKTKKKNKCNFKNCASAPLRMVGTCNHCQGKFCAKHRLLEDHLCIGLQVCKDSAHDQNALKLQSESTIVSRV
ncbi:hypothetical protein PVL30_000703 [Lodderomyces elongisporus]|uniref:uncharacterized protein n=1 Tax=Lodderomyces elongisporus TaxID=36914 RepID=UPI00291D9C7C|nr:uncharacterized protein PVL30_000703 [Lodderomyces elongisporus]WLF76995.1 hypothetical protein PVL30_000703 [Lodderomyces elongisporus]